MLFSAIKIRLSCENKKFSNLTCSCGLDSSLIVWIIKDFTDEVRSDTNEMCQHLGMLSNSMNSGILQVTRHAVKKNNSCMRKGVRDNGLCYRV